MKLFSTMALVCAALCANLTPLQASEDKLVEEYYRTHNVPHSNQKDEVLRTANKISLLTAIMHGSLEIIYNNNNPIIVMPHYESSADNLIEKLVLTDFRLLVATVLNEKANRSLATKEESRRSSIAVRNSIYLEKLEEFSEFEKATDLLEAPVKKKELELIKQNRQELLTALKSGTLAQIETAIKKPVSIKKSALMTEKKKCGLQ